MQKTILFLSCLLAATAQAAPNFPGLRTQMGDWDTVCDNTGGELFLNGQSLGTVAFGKDDYTAALSPKRPAV
ncbi:MAG: hypothetical protein ACFNKE_09000 [Neisseria elongata]